MGVLAQAQTFMVARETYVNDRRCPTAESRCFTPLQRPASAGPQLAAPLYIRRCRAHRRGRHPGGRHRSCMKSICQPRRQARSIGLRRNACRFRCPRYILREFCRAERRPRWKTAASRMNRSSMHRRLCSRSRRSGTTKSPSVQGLERSAGTAGDSSVPFAGADGFLLSTDFAAAFPPVAGGSAGSFLEVNFIAIAQSSLPGRDRLCGLRRRPISAETAVMFISSGDQFLASSMCRGASSRCVLPL